MLKSIRVVIVGDAPKVKLYDASGAGPTVVLIRSSDSGVLIGDSTLTVANGFRLGDLPFPINLRNNDEIWAMASSTCVVSLLVQT